MREKLRIAIAVPGIAARGAEIHVLLLAFVAGGQRERSAGQLHQRAVQPRLVAEEPVDRRREEDLIGDEVPHRLGGAAEAVRIEGRRRVGAGERGVERGIVRAQIRRRIVVVAAVADQRLQPPVVVQRDANARRGLPVLRTARIEVQRQVGAEVVVERVRRARETGRPHEERIGLRNGERRARVRWRAQEVALGIEAVEDDRHAIVDLVGRGGAERVVFLARDQVLSRELIAQIRGARDQRVGIRLRHAARGNGVRRRAVADRAGIAARDAVVATAESALVVAEVVPIVAGERVASRVLVREHELTALADHAPRCADDVFVVLAAVGEAVAAERLDPVERAARNDVHHTGDGVRAVDGRSAIRDDLDALDAERRDDGRIGGPAVVHHAVPVEHHQRRVRPDAAQVHRVAVDDVAVAARLAAGVLADAEVEVLRELLDGAVERDLPGRGDFRRTDGGDRGADRRGAANAAARDDHLFHVIRVGGLRAEAHRGQRRGPQHLAHRIAYSSVHDSPVRLC